MSEVPEVQADRRRDPASLRHHTGSIVGKGAGGARIQSGWGALRSLLGRHSGGAGGVEVVAFIPGGANGEVAEVGLGGVPRCLIALPPDDLGSHVNYHLPVLLVRIPFHFRIIGLDHDSTSWRQSISD